MAIFGDLERLIDDIYPYRWLIAILAVVALSLLLTVAYRYGWHRVLQRHKLRTALVTVPLLLVAIPLSYYLLSPLWTRTTVFEESPLAAASNNAVPGVPAATRTLGTAAPVATIPPSASTATTDTAMPATETVLPTASTAPQPATDSEPAATDESAPSEVPAQTPAIEPAAVVEPTLEPTLEPALQPTPELALEPALEPTGEPSVEVFTPQLVSSGQLSGADDFHFAEGTALLIETAPGVFVLRLEAFSVRNGPDLFVYLAPSSDQLDDSAINLGDLRATDGSINYDIPPGTDISQYQGVIIWCRAFSVFFGSAPLFAS